MPLLHRPPGTRPTALGINLPMQYSRMSIFNSNNNGVQAQKINKPSGSNPLTQRNNVQSSTNFFGS